MKPKEIWACLLGMATVNYNSSVKTSDDPFPPKPFICDVFFETALLCRIGEEGIKKKGTILQTNAIQYRRNGIKLYLIICKYMERVCVCVCVVKCKYGNGVQG